MTLASHDRGREAEGRKGPAPSIDAQAVWHSNPQECSKLYRQFLGYFGGSFRAIRTHYGWTRSSMLWALRYGRSAHPESDLAQAREYFASRGGSHG